MSYEITGILIEKFDAVQVSEILPAVDIRPWCQ